MSKNHICMMADEEENYTCGGEEKKRKSLNIQQLILNLKPTQALPFTPTRLLCLPEPS